MSEAAVIIPHYNDVARLLRCLDALWPQLSDAVELVVVDNGSDQPLDPVRARYPDLRIVTEPGSGAALARNRGVAETSAPRLFFLDADCVPAEGWLAAALAVAPRADLVGGAVDVFDETPPPRTGAEAYETVFSFDYRAYIEKVGFSVTANLLTRRDVFEDVGPFVNGSAEDVDWCWRARDKGYRLVCAEELRVAHPTRPDWPALCRKWRRLARERWVLDGRGQRARWIVKALAMPLAALAHVPRVLRHPDLRGGAERRAAIATLVRLRLARMVWMLRLAAGQRI